MTENDVISANLPMLRELRDRIGQLELAARVGVSRRTIARLENAEVTDPGIVLMGRIAAELGVSLALLTSQELESLNVPLPRDVCEQLRSPRGPETLDAMIRAARRAQKS
ncbi:MAG TPA: helix-turn-helix transcriptional regulator [Polyangiales bacterium]|jgi:transcriptional regulator with XRE-family HTH domain|nr:helix-turn-helix transcriptional regulator [Polyangiales bacterium]